MAAIYTDAGKTAMLNALKGVAVYASLHSADPSTTGANELTGGSPAYARKNVTWGSYASGGVNLSGTYTFDIPPSSTVAYVGLWSAVSAGTFYGYFSVTSEAYTGQGTYILNDGDLKVNDI